MKYSVYKNSYLKDVTNPQEIGEWIESLPNKTTRGILEASKKKSSPIHDRVWGVSDKEAALEYRLLVIRNIVGSISIESPSGPMRAFESVYINDVKQYSGIQTISNNTNLIDQVIQTALNELSYWKLKHQTLSDFFGNVFGEITKAEETYRSANEKGKNKTRGTKKRKANNSANKKDARKHNDSRRVSTSR